MFFQILERVDIQPRVLFPTSDPLPASAPTHQPIQAAAPKQSEELENVCLNDLFRLNFIKAVKSKPILYRSSSKTPLDRVTNEEKKKAWNEISEIMKVPAENCKQKWKSMRDQYVKRRREEIEDPKSITQKKLQFMQAMSFLDSPSRNNSNQKNLPPDGNVAQAKGNPPITESSGDIFILGSDSTMGPLEENSNNETVNVKLEPSSDDQSQEPAFEDSTVPPIQSPSTSCEKEDAVSSMIEELLICPKKKSRKRKGADDPEEILEVAITKLLNEPSPPPEDYLDHRCKALCLMIRSRNLDLRSQWEVLKQCEELVLNYKKNSSSPERVDENS